MPRPATTFAPRPSAARSVGRRALPVAKWRQDRRPGRLVSRRCECSKDTPPRCGDLASTGRLQKQRLRIPAGQLGRLLDPARHEFLVEWFALANVEVAYVLLLRLSGREWPQRRAAEEGHLDVLREAVDAEEPAAAIDAVERGVPFDRLARAGDGAHDQRVEPAPDVALPPRHGRNVRLHGGVAVAF